MFKKILIANRGEIAVRIIRACRELGIKTIAIYSDIDKNSLHVKLADEKVCIGKASSSDSYLNMTAIINTAVLLKAEAIHPGFGFLSENPKFAKMCQDCNITFIGPSYDCIKKMGNKSYATSYMKDNKIPIIPGYDGAITTLEEARKAAKKIGFPVIVKASSGGGGKGMRIVKNKKEFDNLFLQAQEESRISFDDDSMYIEKYIENPKHIEAQIAGDNFGNAISLGLRDCSMQRNNQKVIEETCSNIIDKDLRSKIEKTAIKIVKLVKYNSVGTIEFLVSGKNFYFMEMNTRIQVEHAVTEVATGIDIMKMQIKIASGEKLEYTQKDITTDYHAIECRINAEDTEKKFIPQPGRIKELLIPGGNGIRVDTAVYEGYKIPPTYDSMIIKIVSYDKTREGSIIKMKRALEETNVEGIKTNKKFLLNLLSSEKFADGSYTTSYISNNMI